MHLKRSISRTCAIIRECAIRISFGHFGVRLLESVRLMESVRLLERIRYLYMQHHAHQSVTVAWPNFACMGR